MTCSKCPTKNYNPIIWGYVAGTLSTVFLKYLYDTYYDQKSSTTSTTIERDGEDRTNAGAVMEGNDLSLYYDDPKQLTTIRPTWKFIPTEIYRELVLNTVVCCVDILLVNVTTKQCVLVLRGAEPAKNVWWVPGGRLLKGETFFNAAQRKAVEETGLPNNDNIRPIQILGVWNTFFPTSNWDTTDIQGTQTVNPIVLVEIYNSVDNPPIKLDSTSLDYKWITLDPLDNVGEDKYVQQALLRLRQWNPKYINYKSL